MTANKNAQTKYQALDKCFADNSRRYFVNDLIATCLAVPIDGDKSWWLT